MSRKIYDIIPPKLARKSTVGTKAVSEKITIRKPRKPSAVVRQIKNKASEVTLPNYGKRRFPLREILVGGSVILFLISIYLYNALPKADIQIWLKMEPLSLEEKVTADKSVDTVDSVKKIIPAKYLEQSQDGWQEFEATGSGSNDAQASGTIKIYNKISPAMPFTLIKGTHFLADSGKLFHILQAVTIPAAKNGVVGSIQAKVQAEEAGSDYNIGPSKFSVPGLKGKAYYYGIYAESTSAMQGGKTGKVKKVTDNDIQDAKDVITKKLLDQAEVALRGKLSEDDVLLSEAAKKEVIDFNATVKAGTIIDKFDGQAKVKVSALVFKKQDLEKLAKSDLYFKLADGESLLDKSFTVSYASAHVDSKKGVMMADLKLSVMTYRAIDTNELIDVFSLKSADGMKDIVNAKYHDAISELKVDFWPFWVTSAPKNKNRIKINVVFE